MASVRLSGREKLTNWTECTFIEVGRKSGAVGVRTRERRDFLER